MKKAFPRRLLLGILDFFGPILLTVLILRLCGAQRMAYGILLSAAYSLGGLIYRLHRRKKEGSAPRRR